MEKAQILRNLIEKTGMSFRQFSIKAGVPYTTLLSILDRGVGKASVDNVLKICRALGITTEQLAVMAGERVYEPLTIAAHHDDYNWTEEELKEIEDFKKYVLSKRTNK